MKYAARFPNGNQNVWQQYLSYHDFIVALREHATPILDANATFLVWLEHESGASCYFQMRTFDLYINAVANSAEGPFYSFKNVTYPSATSFTVDSGSMKLALETLSDWATNKGAKVNLVVECYAPAVYISEAARFDVAAVIGDMISSDKVSEPVDFLTDVKPFAGNWAKMRLDNGPNRFGVSIDHSAKYVLSKDAANANWQISFSKLIVTQLDTDHAGLDPWDALHASLEAGSSDNGNGEENGKR